MQIEIQRFNSMKKQHIKPKVKEDDEISHVSSPVKPKPDKAIETSGDNKFDESIDKLFPKKK